MAGADGIDARLLAGIRMARASARERVWLHAADTNRLRMFTIAGGRQWPGIRLLVDATLVTSHSEKQAAAPTFKGGFGFHPLTVWCDNTSEALAVVLRPGNAGANTAADHIVVIDQAVAQIPDAHRHGTPILVSADGAGDSKAWLTHLRGLRDEQMPGPAILRRVHDDRCGADRDPVVAEAGMDTSDRS